MLNEALKNILQSYHIDYIDVFLTLCMLGNFSCFCCRLLTFFKLTFLKKIFHISSKNVSQLSKHPLPFMTESRVDVSLYIL